MTEPAAQSISLVRFRDVQPEYIKLLTPNEDFLADQGCHKCYGRGYTGWKTEKGVVKDHQWCSCLMVNMNTLADRMTRARKEWLEEHPEDLMNLSIAPAAQTEANNGA